MMLYIILPTFNNVKDTKNFIETLRLDIRPDVKLIIIDSHPNLPYRAKFNLDNVIIIEKPNAWWVESINEGLKYLRSIELNESDFVAFANNDVKINWSAIEKLMEELKTFSNQILHPQTINQKLEFISSGSYVHCWLPFITTNPLNITEKTKIHLGTARFLIFSYEVFTKSDFINPKLIQYQGDNHFTFYHFKYNKISTYIFPNATCEVNESTTGLKNHNIRKVSDLIDSFFSIKSANNIKNRFQFVRFFFHPLLAGCITLSMTLNSIIKFLLKIGTRIYNNPHV